LPFHEKKIGDLQVGDAERRLGRAGVRRDARDVKPRRRLADDAREDRGIGTVDSVGVEARTGAVNPLELGEHLLRTVGRPIRAGIALVALGAYWSCRQLPELEIRP
jgi:hypothetical protein